jgi:hypothetical protein
MAIDMKKMRAKYNSLKSGGSDGNFWKPKDGDQVVRILTPPDNDPFRMYWFYYNLDKKPVLCPKRNFGDHSPVLDFASKLWSEGTPDSTKMAKDLFPKQRFFSPVIVRGEEEAGIRIWGYSKTVYEKLLGWVLDKDIGDITDIDTGIDINLNYGKPPGNLYPVTKIELKRKASPLSSGGKGEVSKLLDTMPDFDALFERKSTEDVQELLDRYMSGMEDKKEVEYTSTDSTTEATSEVDKAFEEFSK